MVKKCDKCNGTGEQPLKEEIRIIFKTTGSILELVEQGTDTYFIRIKPKSLVEDFSIQGGHIRDLGLYYRGFEYIINDGSYKIWPTYRIVDWVEKV